MNLHHGQGSFLWMEGDDTPYLDLMMAYGSTNFGHAYETIIGAINAAAKLVHRSTFQSGVSYANHMIVQYAGLNHDYIRFTPSLLITRAELDQAHRLLDKVFAEVFTT